MTKVLGVESSVFKVLVVIQIYVISLSESGTFFFFFLRSKIEKNIIESTRTHGIS